MHCQREPAEAITLPTGAKIGILGGANSPGIVGLGVFKCLAPSSSSFSYIILILILLGVFPRWPHSAGWGYGPSGAVGVILVIVLILLLLGRI